MVYARRMADQRKGVRVHASRGPSSDDYEHPNGVEFVVKDEGHLFVRDSRNNDIAVYAPGKWHHAEVIQPSE